MQHDEEIALAIPEPTLKKMLTTNVDLANTSLATRILVGRLRVDVSSNPAKLAASMAELQAFAAKHAFAQKDFQNV